MPGAPPGRLRAAALPAAADPHAEIAALREENARLTEEVHVARRASDITARLVVEQFERMDDLMRQLEERVNVETRNREYLNALQQTTVGLLSRLDVEAILGLLTERLGQFVGTPHVFLFRVDEEIDRLRCTVGTGNFDRLIGKTLGRGDGLSGRIWESGFPLYVEDYDRWEGRSPDWSMGIFGAAIGAPLRAGGEVVGVLGAAHEPDSGGTFDAVTVTALARFAELASLALDNAHLYEEAERSRRAAEAAARAQSEFLANTSYALRTPMNAILGMAELAKRSRVAPKVRGWLDVIGSQGQTLLEILDRFLDYSNIEAGKLALEDAEFRIDDVLTRLRDRYAARAEGRRLRLTVTAGAGVPPVLVGDPERLLQVLSNLVSNAIRFSGKPDPDGDAPPAGEDRIGEVGVYVQAVADGAGAVELRFTVTDTGVGMTAAQLTRIFEAFHTAEDPTSPRWGGIGLGLAICRRVVDAMGGGIQVESEPGRGTTFHVDLTLPVGDVGAVPAGAAGHLASVSRGPRPVVRHPALRSASVLLVDDDPIARHLVRELLNRHGVRVEVAGDGREALRRLSGLHRFDAVLMDVQMPEMDGLEATRRLRADPRHMELPILAMTAHADQEGVRTCLAAGMDDHIGKPIDEGRLVALLARWARGGDGDGATEEAPCGHGCLDTRSALIRLGGDERLLREMLERFMEAHAADVDAARRALADHDGETADRILHGLRGVAATLGADEVASAADRLAVATAGERWADGERIADELTEAMNRLAHAIHGHVDRPTRSDPVTTWPLVRTPRLVGLLTRLARLLAARDLDAEDAAAELNARLRGTVRADVADGIERAVRVLDYDRAAARLGALLATLGIDPAAPPPATAEDEDEPDDPRPTVLVVDDVAINLRLLGAALRPEARVVFALDGESALERAAGEPPVDIVLLDVVMPGMDGYELCRRWKEDPATASIPVVFVTARADDADVTRGLALGAVDYIVRPLSLEVVRARVRAHVELKRHQDALAALSIEDPLTRLANRRRFDESLVQTWRDAEASSAPVAIVLADIDHFKKYNDRHGHPAGDDCLRQVAEALRGTLRRGTDLVARYGGEEFAAILPGTDAAGAAVVAERMRAAVATVAIPHEASPVAPHVTLSVGVAVTADPRAVPADTLVERADAALYEAKARGRDRVVMAEPP